VPLFYESLLGRNIDEAMWRTIDEEFHLAYHTSLDRAELAPDAMRAVDAVARAGGTQSILSMWWHHQLVPAVQAFGLDERMIAVDGHRGAPGETKVQHLAHHVEQLHLLHPRLIEASLVAIGDITDDAVAAAAVGVDCVLYDSGSQPRSLLEGEKVPVADSLLEAVWLAGVRG